MKMEMNFINEKKRRRGPGGGSIAFSPRFYELEPQRFEQILPPDSPAGVQQPPAAESADGLKPPKMPSIGTAIANGQKQKEKPQSSYSRGIALLGAVVVVLAFGILGVCIATLIRTVQNGQQNETSTSSPVTTTTPTTTTATSTQQTPTSPPTTTLGPLEALHVPAPSKLPLDQTSPKYHAYSNFTQRLAKSLNLSEDPCNNFYDYACGNFSGPMSFDELTEQNINTFLKLIEDESYTKNPKLPLPVKQAIQFHQKCVEAMNDWDAEVGDGTRLRTKMLILENLLDGVPFPAVSDKTQPEMLERPTVEALSIVLGYLSNDEGVDTFVTVGASSNWLEPHGEHPYTLHFDQARLLLPTNYYRKAWNTIYPMLHADLISALKAYAKFVGANVTHEEIEADVLEMMEMEVNIATNLAKGPEERRKFAPQSNVYTFERADTEFGEYLDFELFAFWATVVPDGVDPRKVEPFYVHEPKVLKRTMQFLNKLSPRTLYNYLYVRLLYANLNYLPVPHRLSKIPGLLSSHGIGFPNSENNGISISQLPYDPTDFDIGASKDRNRAKCTSINAQYFAFANARVFLDAQLPDKEKRTKLRAHLRTMVAGVVDSFRGMVAQLGWMSNEVKRRSFLKMDNLVTNMAWPDFIEDDDALTAFYSSLEFNEGETFTQMKDKLRAFWVNSRSKRLFFANDTDRLEFGMPAAIVNAWYSPTRNSITFPLGILSKPFYDSNFPASVNYGALGIVAGHELSHGFDDQGVQWDGTGVLSDWMDANSMANFEEMAQCVVNEYGQFEPLSDMHIDGTMTQGENIADNGGVRAAYRAFQTHVGLYGQDPRLPHDLFGEFTHQQLFFLSFAQVWCESAPDPQELYMHLLVNPHSPSKYRILGSLQNFPAFRQAFHCPAETKYSPSKHCNVWESESAPAAVGVPPTPSTPHPLNIPTQPTGTDNEYVRAANLFEHSVDTSHDPCDNFYEYSCGRFSNSEQISFEAAQGTAFSSMLDGLTEPVDAAVDIRPVVLVKELFQQCKNTIPKWRNWTHGAVRARRALEKFRMASGLGFPLFDHGRGSKPMLWPNATKLGNALGYLSGVEGVDTLLTTFVDVDWMEPQTTDGYTYRLHFDQASLALPRPYYTEKAWKWIKESYREEISRLFNDYASATGFNMKENLWRTVNDILDFEWTVANKLTKADEDRRQYKTMYNPTKLAEGNITFIEMVPFVKALIENARPSHSGRIFNVLLNKPVIFAEPKLFEQYNEAFTQRNINARQLANYLNYRLLLKYKMFIPSTDREDEFDKDKVQKKLHGFSEELKGFKPIEMIRPIAEFEKVKNSERVGQRPSVRAKMIYRYEWKKPPIGRPTFRKRKRLPSLKNGHYGLLEEYCAFHSVDYLPYANARVLVDQMLPGARERNVFRNKFGKFVSTVVDGFKSMLEQLEWIEPSDKRKAIDKAENVVRNIGYPDLVTDDRMLNAQMERLKWRNSTNPNFFEMMEDIELFNSANAWDALLTIGPADRQQFSESPAIVNAWYQPQLNSITFPLALLQPPFFDPGWPDSINYGAIGVVIGHELVHAFDDEGIQWGPVGGLRDWMGAASVGAFRKMADCVVDEFGAFCPLNGTELSPSCIDGSATQGENIADSGGIEAAFRAFRNSLSFYGPNPRLPGGLAGQFSDDQLFFLSFANIWCERPMDVDEGEEFAQLLLDTHSPPKFRVLGTLRNFPAFRTAFNCPLGKRYAPPETEHCNVWVDEIKAVDGVAPQIAARPAINVPERKQSNDGFFTKSANLLAASMDSKKDPCNDFNAYACANFEGPMHFNRAQQQSIFDSLIALFYNLMDIPTTLPKEQSKEFFRKCLNDTTNWRQLTNESRVVLEHMAKFKRRTRIPFPLMDAAAGKQIAYDWPVPTAMGNALAYLSSNYGSDTLLSTSVDTNWGDPQGNQPYSLYIDQGALALPQKYYSDPVWTRINQSYVEEMANLLGRYVRASGMQVNETEVRKVAEQIGHFEYTFANHLMTEEERRTNFSRMYNPMKFMEVAESLSWVDLQIYMLEMLFTAATPEVVERLFQERYSVVVMEPEMLKKMSNAFKHDNPFGFAPAHLFNYLNFRLLLSLSPYFESDSPFSSKVFRNVPELYVRPPTGRPRWEEPIFDMNEFFGDDQSKAINSNPKMNPFMTLIGCTLFSLEMLPHQTSRLYLDFVLPRERDRLYLRKTVANIVENVVVGFDSMLDQLEWMGEASKKSASEKVGNMVRNIGFPDWIVDDQQLNAYSKQFPLIAGDNLIETKFRISNFFLKKAVEPLAWKGHTNRTNFNGLPMTVNAWYQPQLNSITFPLAILTPPFFHPNNPTALNYGIFGAIVGHELTHAFDSTGTQFDAFGKLRQWMDPKSMAAFNAMVQCVIYQYGRFCPNSEKKGTANCVDGIRSQGENVADNGGIRAAYRAYKNAMDYRGADFALPGPLLSQYDHEQLFFLSFAQTWCQPPENIAKTHQRLLFDVHPSPEFRLLGSLQNFPAFQNAFHCPKNSLYAPIDRCDVWVSDVKLVNGEHFPPPPSLNIPSREKESSRKFREASEYFEKSVDIGQDPCNNFYEYACNAFEGVAHFDRISMQNLIILTNALKGDRHEQIEPIQKAKLAFQKCNLMMNNYQEVLKKADLPREKFFLFQKKSRLDFPIFAGQKLGWPTRDELSTALGALSGSILVDTLISFSVDTNWEDPNSEEMPYALFIDQPTLAFDPANYSPEMFPRVYHQIETFVSNTLIAMANYMDVEYTWNDLKHAVQEVIGFERVLANHFLASADSRLNDFGSRFNVFSVSEAQRQFPFLNWSLFLRELAENAPQTVKEKMRQPNFRFAIVEPSLLAKLGNELGPGNSYNITANQLLNYFYFRLILSTSTFMPQDELSKNETISVPFTENWSKRTSKFGGHIIKPVSSKDYFFYRPSVGRPKRMEIFSKEKMRKVNAEIFYSEFLCAQYTLAMMDLVSGRLWLDHALPSREMRMNVKKGAKKLVNSILLSFRSMVQQISWMSPRAKSSAHNKLDKIMANIGWPQIMVNNSELEQYYKALVFTDDENFLNIWEKGMKFAYTRQWQHLLKRQGTDRTEFNEQIILVNAWYQPELNSITVPASILSQPFFDKEWPDSINYGAIGAVLGHELSHGFDNFGVQWDSDGSAIKWLDARSQLAFDRMAKCLVDEYSQLCPFPREGQIQPACIDGNKTQGENIADNGGLHAAFRAYRSALEVDGPSKALPGDLIGRFSPDQLFFMSFAQPWCEEPNESETFHQLMEDTHSPAKFRVLGSLRNFPAFRDSFNCPLNSKYAPEKHCEVWVNSVTEKPIAAPPANLLNVPTAQMARADDDEFAAYKSAVQYFKNSMNLASDPCNNFYEYACANYRGPTGFAVKQADNYKRIATAIEQIEPKPDSALEKLKQFFTTCTSTLPQLDALILDGAVLRAKLDRFIAFTDMDFPLFSVRSSFDMPNGDTLARALAWLSAREGVDTLVTPFVDVELAPSEEGQKGPQNYRLFLDQNTLAFRKSYYQPGTWELIREKYATNAKTLLRRVGHILGKATDEKVLEEAVQGLLELELRLAREFSTDEEKRMDVGRWAHTLDTLDNANRVLPLLEWNTYFKQLTELSGVNLGDPKKKQFAYFIEGNMMGKLSDALTKKEKDGREVGAVQLANYLFFRLLLQNVQFIPKPKLEKTSNYRSDYAPIFETKEEEHFLVDQPPLIGGGWRNRRLLQRARWAMEDPFKSVIGRWTDAVETICAAQSSNLLGMASARVFADLLYPGGQKQREELRKSVSRMVNGVHHSYRAMLDELDWLDGATRGEAMAKLDQLRVHIGSPDWIHSDSELDSFFDELNFENATDYFNSLDQLTTFNNFLQFRLLQEDKFKVNRSEFMGLPTAVNAWYFSEFNSITFPDGILRRPFFDPQWPAAVNYGALGSLAGHEISHAFDDDGVQWNSEGFLKRWMGNESQKDFDRMAKCVVGEYGAIEVLDPAKYRPSNISGLRTQGENIADNAGIIAAFRAFKLHSALNGPDPRLPDQSLNGLSADQLFFLSFAQNWCQSPPSEAELFRQILVDPHAPSKVRVLGTLRNFPAFREAFNCRTNSFYAAKKRCHVWVPEKPDF